MEIPMMMKLREASQACGVSYDRLRKLCLDGIVSHIRSGRDFYINMNSLATYLNESGKKLANDADENANF